MTWAEKVRFVVDVRKMKGEQVVQVLEALWLNFLREVGSQFLRWRVGLVGLGKKVKVLQESLKTANGRGVSSCNWRQRFC